MPKQIIELTRVHDLFFTSVEVAEDYLKLLRGLPHIDTADVDKHSPTAETIEVYDNARDAIPNYDTAKAGADKLSQAEKDALFGDDAPNLRHKKGG